MGYVVEVWYAWGRIRVEVRWHRVYRGGMGWKWGVMGYIGVEWGGSGVSTVA